MSAGQNAGTLTRDIFAAAVQAADPAAFTRDALAQTLSVDGLQQFRRHWIIALGKAAIPMAHAALAHADSHDLRVAGGLVVGHTRVSATHTALDFVCGDHPIPSEQSARAAEQLAALCGQIAENDLVLLLVSGGTSSLIGAPVDGIPRDDFATLFEMLLGSGLDIAQMNAVRKRFSRWGAGRLAAALAPAAVQPVILSDVPDDDPALVGSGPCEPDPTTAEEVEAMLRAAGIAKRIPLSIASQLGAIRAGALPETPKPGSPVFYRVRPAAIAGNRAALNAGARYATTHRIRQVVTDERPLQGDAMEAGRAIARAALAAEPGSCFILGGETTVTLPETHGVGGRNQQLALAAAEVLSHAGVNAPHVTILSAGSDGRDGLTDAAGAVVDNTTWDTIAVAGFDPASHLARYDAYPALDAARALVKTGPTGTNVADIVVVMRE